MMTISRDQFIRPSTLGRLAACRGSAAMEARALTTLPILALLESSAAKQGEAGHRVVALGIANRATWTAENVERSAIHLERWSRDATLRCHAYAMALIEQHPQATVCVERHLAGDGIGIARGGTADLILVERDRIIVADWKLGWRDQGHAADSLQLAAYACMAYSNFATAFCGHESPGLKTVEVHLCQGRRREFTAASYRYSDLCDAADHIHTIVAKAKHYQPEITAGIHCLYCKALCLCRKAREYIMNAADELALFGSSPEDAVKLADDAALARRFAEDAAQLVKLRRQEAAGKDDAA